MYFPIAGVTVNPFLLALIGFAIGVLGGFFGVGGGFLAGPFMFLLGVPMNSVVGTDLTHIAGKSVVATRQHWTLGHVDFRLGVLMIFGTIPGVELGAQIIEGLERVYAVDRVVGSAYIVLLLTIGAFMAWEGWQAVRRGQTAADQPVWGRRVRRAMRAVRLPPMIRLPVSRASKSV